MEYWAAMTNVPILRSAFSLAGYMLRWFRRGIFYLKDPCALALALIRTAKMKMFCEQFGNFSGNNNIFYANGVKIYGYSNISIGERVSFGGNVYLMGHDRIEIGDDCMFAYGVIICTATHDYQFPIMNRSYVTKPVKIGSNVWCGLNSIILPGITISDGSVIGAGAVVTKDVPKNAIVAGVPARIIGIRKIKELESSCKE